MGIECHKAGTHPSPNILRSLLPNVAIKGHGATLKLLTADRRIKWNNGQRHSVKTRWTLVIFGVDQMLSLMLHLAWRAPSKHSQNVFGSLGLGE